MKKLIAILSVCLMVFLLFACAQQTQPVAQQTTEAPTEAVAEADNNSITFTAGTYEGTGKGYNGNVTVKVTVSDTNITDIEVLDSKETAHVGDVSFPILKEDIIACNGVGVDTVSGATFSSFAYVDAVKDALSKANCSNMDLLNKNKVNHTAGAKVTGEYDIIVVGAGGAGMSAAAQATQDGNSVLVIEKNAEIGGNTLVSGGQYQTAISYLVWDPENPEATTGVGFDGQTYDKVKAVQGSINQLKTILNWNEGEFDADYYKTNEFVAGDTEELSKHGVHAEYLPVLKELKKEIQAYLNFAEPKIKAGTPEAGLPLFSTLNLHIFQTYFGGLRQSADKSEWIYGDIDLVKQFVEGGQEVKPWLQAQGSIFNETQPTLIGALWWRENEVPGSDVDMDGDGEKEHYTGNWGAYFAPTFATFKNGQGNKILTRTTATDLIMTDGRVTGVKGKMYDGTEVEVTAKKGVILSTGGYAANINKVLETNKYWSSEYLTKYTKTTNRSSQVGDGIDMAEKVNADTTGMGYTQLMPISWIDNGNLAFGGGDYAVFINPTTGKRFVDENSERDVLSLEEFKNGIERNGAQGVFIEIANYNHRIPGPYLYADEDVKDRQYVRTIGEFADLFKELGLETDADEVIKTLREYDQAMLNGEQPKDAGKAACIDLIGNIQKDENGGWDKSTYDLDNARLRVRLMAPSTHHTMGGVKVDTERRVLDKDGNAIKGLYAAGEVTGGIHGGNRLGGNAIVEIIVSGRTAAQTINSDN